MTIPYGVILRNDVTKDLVTALVKTLLDVSRLFASQHDESCTL